MGKRYNKRERELMLYRTFQSIYAELKAIRIHLEPQSKENNMMVTTTGRLMADPIRKSKYETAISNHPIH